MLISCFVSVFQGYTFLISSDYEREEWREIIREQQKKCKHCCSSRKPSHLPRKPQQDSVNCSIPSVTYWLNTDIGDFTEWVSLGFYMFFSHRFKSFSLTSLELQMLTNSCVKLQTVHHVPLTINKEGECLFCFALLRSILNCMSFYCIWNLS